MKVREFVDGSYLEYSAGNFDQWCVYMVNPAKNYRRPPLDVDYFAFLKKQANVFGAQKIYDDFVLIYDKTGRVVDNNVLEYIDSLASEYGNMQLEFAKVFTILYMGMLAEANKAYTRLGKRIKRLGMYKLLIENSSVNSAANFMRNMGWREIDMICRRNGF